MNFNFCRHFLPDLDDNLDPIIEHPIVIEYADGDELIHTDDHPECEDSTCYCHQAVQQ